MSGLLLFLLLLQDWPQFRGPGAHGIDDSRSLPTTWDVSAGENVLWNTPIPGLAHSAPIVQGDAIYVTTARRLAGEAELGSLYGSENYGAGGSVSDEGAHAFDLLCIDRATGAIRWTRTAHEGVPQVKRHPKSTHANSTPASDAERVVAFFGSEGLYCYDHDGELLWKRDLGRLDAGAPRGSGPPDIDYDDYQWGFASSPVIAGSKVIVQCDVQGQSFVAALDVETGADVWRTERDEPPTWCTPTVVRGGERPQVVCNGYVTIAGYDLETGEMLWRRSGGGDVPVPTPVVMYDLVFLTSAHGREAPLYALDILAAAGELEADSEAIAWFQPRRGIYMQTPLIYDSELYACSDGGIVGCFDAGTGEMHYRERLGSGTSGFSASAVAGDEKLYFTGESGEVFVVKPGPEFEVLAVNDLGENCLATPAISDGALYFRTRGHLIAIGASSEAK